MPIIAFSKDWHEAPTSNNHVLAELAKSRRVLWLNSIATRTPDLGSARDLEKLRRKLGEIRHGAVQVIHDLWVATPLVLPFPHSRIARAINRQLLRATVSRLRRQLGIDRFQLWTFLPNTAPYLGTLGEQLAVYYCVDEWTTFPGLDREGTRRVEHALLDRVDLTFTTSLALLHAKRRHCEATHHAPHGVDHAKFARALAPEVEVPADLAALPRPRIGFHGTLRDFIDVELIAEVARARPQWTFALIGKQLTDVTALRLPNIHLLGPRSHDELPAYCKGFDVGLIPYRLDHDAQFINPLKLKEYLAAGVPVVSTALPEVLPYASACHLGSNREEMIAGIERALREGSPEQRAARSALMSEETWAALAQRVAKIADTAARAKHRSPPSYLEIPLDALRSTLADVVRAARIA